MRSFAEIFRRSPLFSATLAISAYILLFVYVDFSRGQASIINSVGNEESKAQTSMDISRIDIAELAELLEDRKNNDKKIALILGSRTGALFRSQSFAEEMVHYSTSTRSFVDMNERERFTECYSLLKTAKRQIDRKDLEILLNQKIRNINFSMADDCLAALIEQKFFRLILSSSVDDLLYDALIALELKEMHDFVNFDLGRLSIMDTVEEILFHEKISACKVIKFYTDVDAFVHRLDKPQVQAEISQCVKNLLERMRIFDGTSCFSIVVIKRLLT